MQVVWNRVAASQAACRCAHCAVKTGLARQAVSVTGKRPSKFLTSSTLLYSGIFALAATTDAVVKERRNQQWSRAIADVEQELRVDEKREYGDHFMDMPEVMLEDGSVANHIYPENTGDGFEKASFAPQSLYATPRFKAQRGGLRVTAKKLNLTELAVDKLILETVLLTDRDTAMAEMPKDLSNILRDLLQRPRSRVRHMLHQTRDRIREVKRTKDQDGVLQTMHYRGSISKFGQDEQRQYLQLGEQMASRLVKLFRAVRAGDAEKRTVQWHILDELVTSPVPPTLRWWSNLLKGLSYHNFDVSFIDSVVNAMRISQLRVDEHVLATMLNHYRKVRDHKGFRRWTDMMNGARRGLMLARPDIWITEAGKRRLALQDHADGNEKIVQLPRATPMVFQAYVRGVLELDGFESALSVCQQMAANGWGLSMKGLTPLLAHCAEQKDWSTGLQIWQLVKGLRERSRNGTRPESIQEQTYASMLALCWQCDKPLDYGSVMDEAVVQRIRPSLLMRRVKLIEEGWRNLPAVTEQAALPDDTMIMTLTEADDAVENHVGDDTVDSSSQGQRGHASPTSANKVDGPSISPQLLESQASLPRILTAKRSTAKTTLDKVTTLSREHLTGHEEATTDIAMYEAAERPMEAFTISTNQLAL